MEITSKASNGSNLPNFDEEMAATEEQQSSASQNVQLPHLRDGINSVVAVSMDGRSETEPTPKLAASIPPSTYMSSSSTPLSEHHRSISAPSLPILRTKSYKYSTTTTSKVSKEGGIANPISSSIHQNQHKHHQPRRPRRRSSQPNPPPPLSWKEARSRMRHVLEDYMKLSSSSSLALASSASPDTIKNSMQPFDEEQGAELDNNQHHQQQTKWWDKLQSWWLDNDLDMYCGSVLFSIAFLVLSILSYQQCKKQQQQQVNQIHSSFSWLHVQANLSVYKSQIVAATIYLVTSLTSVWVVRRRRSTSLRDGECKKRSTVASFLRVLDSLEVQTDATIATKRKKWEERNSKNWQEHEEQTKDEINDVNNNHGWDNYKMDQERKMKLNGTPLTDIYSVYRVTSDNANHSKTKTCTDSSTRRQQGEEEGEWHRIPSLLLVKGDYIALQIGDVTPADCVFLNSTSSDHIIQAGTKIDATAHKKTGSSTTKFGAVPRHHSINSMSNTNKIGTNVNNYINSTCDPNFPLRSSLPANSKKLLNLCRNMQVYRLMETPLERFLRTEQAVRKSPQIHRQALSIRFALHLFYLGIFILTSLLILIRVRPGSNPTNNGERAYDDLSLLLTLPLMASIGVLPVMTPLCIVALEILGTSRILSVVHLYASKRNPSHRYSFDQPLKQQYDDNRSSRYKCNGINHLFLRYFVKTFKSRLSLGIRNENTCTPSLGISKLKFRNQTNQHRADLSSAISINESRRHDDDFDDLVDIPPASSCIFERLGVATALALVDDELVCDPHSTPQQLLIPSGHGLKLLDLCPKFDDDDGMEESVDEGDGKGYRYGNTDRRRTKSYLSSVASESDSDDEQDDQQQKNLRKRTLAAITRRYRRKLKVFSTKKGIFRPESHHIEEDNDEVQFEDPNWWQYLPSLKCIGLDCLLVDNKNKSVHHNHPEYGGNRGRCEYEIGTSFVSFSQYNTNNNTFTSSVDNALIRHVCQHQSRSHLLSLAQCIGFSTEPNSFGPRGDISPFIERRRLHLIATRLLSSRISVDRHAIGLEESRNFGLLKTDATSVLVQDLRTKAHQLLTVGDARVVTEFCTDSWQGENSTITPLSAVDRKAILDNSKNWSLADLDVAAFSYAPVPDTLEQRIVGEPMFQGNGDNVDSFQNGMTYLVDNRLNSDLPLTTLKGESGVDDWSLVRNQIFLGLLGSSISPRKEIEPVIEVCANAGIRFVYFSPRNMRRTKELASQMGIDVAWNCAISLRPLDEGEEADAHRMTSNYADWDVNARLPHGVEDVKRHLKEVDNVPLLVSLYTDVTKHTTAEMVHVFQKYNDTVLALGLSHLLSNNETFSVADLSIGVDVLAEDSLVNDSDGKRSILTLTHCQQYSPFGLVPEEISFVSSIAAHSCLFNLPASHALLYLSEIIARGREALDAGKSAGLFMVTGYLSFSLFVVLSCCTVSATIPFIPGVGSVLYLLIIIPMIGLAMNFTEADNESMDRVPTKNDESITFATGERRRIFLYIFLRALPPSIGPHLMYLISLGSSVIEFEPTFLVKECSVSIDDSQYIGWTEVITCDSLRFYSGPARISSGHLMVAELALCIITLSASFVFRMKSLKDAYPWKKNRIWFLSTLFSLALVVVYLGISLENGTLSCLPWYFFLLALLFPLLSLFLSEIVKKTDMRHEKRADMLRRLQFETRLGMWSPK